MELKWPRMLASQLIRNIVGYMTIILKRVEKSVPYLKNLVILIGENDMKSKKTATSLNSGHTAMMQSTSPKFGKAKLRISANR